MVIYAYIINYIRIFMEKRNKQEKTISFRIPNKYYEALEEISKKALSNNKENLNTNTVNYVVKELTIKLAFPTHIKNDVNKYLRENINDEKFIEKIISIDNDQAIFFELNNSINHLIEIRNEFEKVTKDFKEAVNKYKKEYKNIIKK